MNQAQQEVMREQFEEWADDYGFCMDERFFEDGNSYIDEDTRLAFDIWRAAYCAALDE